MMAQKHLHELLQEDQEPFLLKNYIADRRCQLKRPSHKTHLLVKKRKPISHQTSNFPQNFCKNACFFSFNNSPDPRKSPLFDFHSPVKSPCRTPNAIFLHIPARTAALLLEAALRIQKQSSSPKTKPQNKNSGFGLFGSILKRLTHRNKTRKGEISGDGVKVSVKDILRWDSSAGRKELSNERNIEPLQEIMVGLNDKSASGIRTCEMSFSCSCNGRPSSAVWSEKSLDFDLDTSSSTSHSAEEDLAGNVELFNIVMINDISVDDFASYDKHFCESPFHFVLQRSPSSGRRTPDFSSPATSPIRHNIEGKENNDDVQGLKKFQEEAEEEEDKEQCSPVSVLDPPFEDDDDGNGDQSEDDGCDLECGYAIVQRAKQQLLQKLRRFEKLAGLDPVELEKRMLEQEHEVDDENNDINDLEEDDELASLDKEKNVYRFIIEELGESSFHCQRKIPRDMKRLVSDLIDEEKRERNCFADKEAMVKRVCNRLESWKDVESNTIDMMVEQDFKIELDGWKRNQEQVGETALEIELGIFGFLVEELSEELVGLTGI